MQQRSQAARAHCDTNYVLTEHNSITTSACRLCMFNQPLPWLAQHSGYCSTGCVGVCPQSAAPDLGSAAAKDTLLISMFQRIHGHCLALLCVEQCEWCCLSLHTTDMNSKIVFLAYFLAPLWLKLTHPVGRVVGLLRGRGLVLGRTPETHTVVWWATKTRDSFSYSPDLHKDMKNGCSRPSSGKTDTHSPFSLLSRCLRYIAMAVPTIANTSMTAMMPPMMLPVAGPFSGRRFTRKTGRSKETPLDGTRAGCKNTGSHDK